jgi:hypothetical protein
MKSMRDFKSTNCVFDCSPTAEDSLEHYFHCPRVRKALRALCADARTDASDPASSFFGVRKGMAQAEKVTAARLLHTTLRIMHFARRMGPAQDFALIAGMEWHKTFTG